MRYVLKKFLTLIITLLLISVLAFVAFQVIPGDPTTKMLGTEATPEAVAALRAEMGLDKPTLVRYWSWLKDFVQGDLGTSYSYGLPVSQMISEKLPITAFLTILSFCITVVVAIPLGTLAGSVRNPVADVSIATGNQILMSIPGFFLGMIICYVCGIVMKLFVPGNFVSWSEDPGACAYYLLFPAVSIAVPRIAMTVKMLRGSIAKELGQEYVITAKSRGNGHCGILFFHVLKNAMIPVITFLAVSMAEVLTGSIIVEQVFTVPGIGRLLLASIGNRDFPVVQAIVVILATWIVVVNFIADLLNQAIDPRMRLH